MNIRVYSFSRRKIVGVIALIKFLLCINDIGCLVLSLVCMYSFVFSFSCSCLLYKWPLSC
jgi:ABC-type maltose transport system permease subunit